MMVNSPEVEARKKINARRLSYHLWIVHYTLADTLRRQLANSLYGRTPQIQLLSQMVAMETEMNFHKLLWGNEDRSIFVHQVYCFKLVKFSCRLKWWRNRDPSSQSDTLTHWATGALALEKRTDPQTHLIQFSGWISCSLSISIKMLLVCMSCWPIRSYSSILRQ